MLALEHLKVLDLTRLLPGPFAVMFLADMGANVIKIEEPRPQWVLREGMVSTTATSKAEEERVNEIAAAYRFVDRNKRSVCLDLKTQEGRDIFYKLAKTADVVVDEFRPGVTKRLGVDYDTLKVINPRIICCSISGYGQDGPYYDLPGHDPCYEAMSGILGITGTRDNHTLPGVPIGDLGAGGMQGAIGILLALIAREKTGRGQFVDISILDCLVTWLMVRYGAQFLTTGRQLERGERPAHVYETKDGKYICVAPAEPWFWERLCQALGLDEFIPYQEAMGVFRPDSQELLRKREEMLARFAEVFRTKTRDEWFNILREKNTCVAPVYRFDEVLSSPQVVHRQIIQEVDHPTLGKVKQVSPLIRLSDTPGKIRFLAPQRGQHTEECLLELGYASDEIKALHKREVCRCNGENDNARRLARRV